jgi:hypothetical protein
LRQIKLRRTFKEQQFKSNFQILNNAPSDLMFIKMPGIVYFPGHSNKALQSDAPLAALAVRR